MNNTKRILLLAVAGFTIQNVHAQSLDDGIKMLRYEKFESAKKIIEPLAAGNSLANYYLGVTEMGLDQNAKAKTIFAKYADDAANMAGMARVLFAEGKTADALNMAKASADKAKKKDLSPYKFAADAITYSNAAGNYQTAIDWYKKYMEKTEDAAAYVAMGDAYIKIPGGGGEAMTAYENAVRMNAQNSLAFSRIGALWYAAKRYDLALESYQKAKDADPNNPIPYRDLAYAYYYVNKFDLSRQNIEKYLELSDKSVDDQIQYVGILYRGKEYAKAISTAQALLNSGNTRPGLYGILAYSQLESGDSIVALDNVRKYFSMQKAERIFPEDYIKYGRIMLKTGEVDSANYYFNRGIALDTNANKAETYRAIGDAFKDLKSEEGYAKAGEWYGRIIKDDAKAAPLDYFYYGVYNYYGKNYTEAKRAFADMETTHPDQPSATYWRGRTAAAMDPEAKGTEADDYYIKWLNGTSEKKSADLMQAYQWLALYYYNQKDKANMDNYIGKILQLDPNNSFAKQLKGLK